MVRSNGLGTIITSYFDRGDGKWKIPTQQQPRDMRPRVVDRAKVKAGRKVARKNKRRR